MLTPRVKLSPARPEESSRIYAFYQEAQDPGVLPRPEADLEQAAEKGLFFVGRSGGKIVAVAGVFDLGLDPYVELGGTFVAPSVRGFGLQGLLFKLRIAATVVNQGSDARMLTAINPANTPSAKNATKAGFISWTNPASAVLEPCVNCPKRSAALVANRRCCCDFFVLPDNEARKQVREFLILTQDGSMIDMSGRAGESLTVNIESNLLSQPYRLALDDFASGQNW
jgi:hypothetical protein